MLAKKTVENQITLPKQIAADRISTGGKVDLLALRDVAPCEIVTAAELRERLDEI